MLPSDPGALSVPEGLECIRSAAAERSLIFQEIAKRRIRACGLDPVDVAEMLSVVSEADIYRDVAAAEHFHGCDMYTFRIYDGQDQWGDVWWYTHVAVNKTKRNVVIVASWKLDGSAA